MLFCLGGLTAQAQESRKPRTEPKTYSSDRELNERFPTPFLRAIVTKRAWLVQAMLEKGEQVNPSNGSPQNLIPLHAAILAADANMARLLIRYKAKVDAHDSKGLSALILACALRNVELVDVLIESGANVNYRALRSDLTPLVTAASGGSLEIAERLLIHGADANLMTSALGATPLMAAADSRAMVDLLISNGADVHRTDMRGWTALYYAISDGRLEKMKSLLTHGARTDVVDKDGVSPQMLIEREKDERRREAMTEALSAFLSRRDPATTRQKPIR